MNHASYTDAYIAGILGEAKTIAMVGASATSNRPSYFAMKYLLGKGYRVIPVNPGLAGKEILGQRVYASLGEVPGPVDIVDIFRSSAAALEIAREAIRLKDTARHQGRLDAARRAQREGRGGSGSARASRSS